MRLVGVSLLLPLAFVATVNGAGHEMTSYEVWGCDQSNSVANQTALGVRGSWLWIWDSMDVASVAADNTVMTPPPKPCTPDATAGPCDLNAMFPIDMLVHAETNEALRDASGFGRWHGITKDPQNLYVTANIFAPGGGFLGIVDTTTKAAVALFRVTQFTYSRAGNQTDMSSTRNVHMSFWNADGSAILIHNLAGKAVERINVERDSMGMITAAVFDKSATVGMGKEMQVAEPASYYVGPNAFGKPLLGAVTGTYDEADLGDLTPAGRCKENGCITATDLASPERPNNVPICPIIAPNGLVFNTFGGGGLIVLDSTTTPMQMVGAYGNSVIYGAGVCGEAVGSKAYFTSGVSASGAGVDQSMWALWAFDADMYPSAILTAENMPMPDFAFEFDGTATGGRTTTGNYTPGDPRRDAHDLAGTIDGKYVHVVDRILNVIDVFDVETDEHVGFYDLTTMMDADGNVADGGCAVASVTDGGPGFVTNDPAADFIAATPDGQYMMLSLRGPAPVSAIHAAQGSCPGVGVVKLEQGGTTGSLVAVLRSTNTLADMAGSIAPPQGVPYPGMERSDVHDVVVVYATPAAMPTMAPTPTEDDSPSPSPTSDKTTESPTSAAMGITTALSLGIAAVAVVVGVLV